MGIAQLLAREVNNRIPDDGHRQSKEFPGIALSCHFATTYWLFKCAFGRTITLQELGIVQPQPFIASLIPKSVKKVAIHRSDKKFETDGLKLALSNTQLQKGLIIVYSHSREAGHSCVVRDDGRIAGYNQLGWMTDPENPGENHGYSDHHPKEIGWKSKVMATNAGGQKEFDLVAIAASDAAAALGNRLGLAVVNP